MQPHKHFSELSSENVSQLQVQKWKTKGKYSLRYSATFFNEKLTKVDKIFKILVLITKK